MSVKFTKIVVPSLIGLSFLSGCGDNSTNTFTKNTTSVVSSQGFSSQKNLYTSLGLGNGQWLIGGEDGISITSDSSNQKMQKTTSTFQIPVFQSSAQVIQNKNKLIQKSDVNETVNLEKSQIYTMESLNDGILVGGSFASVNGIPRNNLVKIKFDGSIDMEFNNNIVGTVNKIIKEQDRLYIGGVIGAYNGKEAYGIVQTDFDGKINEEFLPFQDYVFVKINDMLKLDNNNLMLAGTFIKDATEGDENQTQEELINLTKTIVVLDKQGQINEDLTAKYSDVRGEVFSLALDENQIYIAGDFSLNKDGKEYNNLVRYNYSGDFDENFQIAKLHGMVFDVVTQDDKIVFGGDFLIDNNTTTRSFYIVDKSGNTVTIDNLEVNADIYNIDTYNGNIIITGDGEFQVENQQFENSLVLKLDI